MLNQSKDCNRIGKITALIKNDNISHAVSNTKSISSKSLRSAMIMSFEKTYIGITTDVLAEKIKTQLTNFEKIQKTLYKKITESNFTKDINLYVATSNSYKEYLRLIFQLRGDLQEAKLQVAQQFSFGDKEQIRNFSDFVIDASQRDFTDMIQVEESGVIDYAC